MKRNSAFIMIEKILEIILYSIGLCDCILNIKELVGYSDSEIKNKEALENVLIPYKLDENISY